MRPADLRQFNLLLDGMKKNQKHPDAPHAFKVALDFTTTKLWSNAKDMQEPDFSDYLEGYDFNPETMEPITNPTAAYKAGLAESLSDAYFLNRVADRFNGLL